MSLALSEIKYSVQRKFGLAKWGLGLLTIALAAPLIWMLASSLAAVVVIGVITMVAVSAYEPLLTKLANKRIEVIIAEVRKRPIETLINDYKKQTLAVADMRDRTNEYARVVGAYEAKVEAFCDKYPNDAVMYRRHMEALQQRLRARMEKYNAASKALAEYERVIERAQAIWEIDQATIALRETPDDFEDEFMSKLKRQTALDHVQASLYGNIAELELLNAEDAQDDTPMQLTKPTANQLVFAKERSVVE